MACIECLREGMRRNITDKVHEVANCTKAFGWYPLNGTESLLTRRCARAAAEGRNIVDEILGRQGGYAGHDCTLAVQHVHSKVPIKQPCSSHSFDTGVPPGDLDFNVCKKQPKFGGFEQAAANFEGHLDGFCTGSNTNRPDFEPTTSFMRDEADFASVTADLDGLNWETAPLEPQLKPKLDHTAYTQLPSQTARQLFPGFDSMAHIQPFEQMQQESQQMDLFGQGGAGLGHNMDVSYEDVPLPPFWDPFWDEAIMLLGES
ncbi:hypothetical protein G7046_g3295 [Stylonectria norvegica]|nr:hypothetical protein G7046_g3295 [Stylonectria norvegica]